METREKKRRVVDVSKMAHLVEGWGNDGWAKRGDNDCVTVTARLAGPGKDFNWVSVRLAISADQVRKLARVSHVDEEIIGEWVNDNTKTVQSTAVRDQLVVEATKAVDRLTRVVESQRRKLDAIQKALGAV